MPLFAWNQLSRKRKILLLSVFILFDLILVCGVVAWLAYTPPQAPPLNARPSAATKNLPASIHEFEGAYYYSAPASNLLDKTLTSYVDADGGVDYSGLAKDRRSLLDYYNSIAYMDERAYQRWTKERQLVFWINAYNALTLLIIAENHPIGSSLYGLSQNVLGHDIPANSIRNLPWVWEQTAFIIMGKARTLNDIEHHILRKEFKEPRIHMAINCASAGCPPLRNEIYQEHQINKQLEEQTRVFLLSKKETKVHINKEAQSVSLSPILDWFGEDFIHSNKPADGQYTSGNSEKERAVLLFVSRYLSQADADYLRNEKYTVLFRNYDWSLNQAP